MIPYASACSSHEQPRTYAFSRDSADARSRTADGTLRIVQLIEDQRFDLAAAEIAPLERGTDLDREVAVILSRWLDERRRPRPDGGGVAVPPKTSEPAPDRLPEDVTRLKNEGLNHYSEGRLDQAIRCWNEALEISPGDPEIEKFLRRAREVRRNCDGSTGTAPPAPALGS